MGISARIVAMMAPWKDPFYIKRVQALNCFGRSHFFNVCCICGGQTLLEAINPNGTGLVRLWNVYSNRLEAGDCSKTWKKLYICWLVVLLGKAKHQIPTQSNCRGEEVIIAMPPQEAEDFRSSLLTGGVSEACGNDFSAHGSYVDVVWW